MTYPWDDCIFTCMKMKTIKNPPSMQVNIPVPRILWVLIVYDPGHPFLTDIIHWFLTSVEWQARWLVWSFQDLAGGYLFQYFLGEMFSRWFKPWPLYPLVGGHQQPLKGSLNHPKKVTKNCQVMILECWPPNFGDMIPIIWRLAHDFSEWVGCTQHGSMVRGYI